MLLRDLNEVGNHHKSPVVGGFALYTTIPPRPFPSTAMLTDTGMVASCGMDRTVKLWDLTTLGLQKTLLGHVKVRRVSDG